ncbi:diguanylate phosphodiesterase [Thioclava sp. FR2]|uniref:diguanylate phosphodiesterase n=1 Tax=Thioclava sp. FR2 TaxID=3445780 RepID=UPI003EB98E52
MARLIHIIYSSAAKTHFGPEELLALLGSARSKNTSLNISGMLLHIEGSFLQVIEGNEADIDALFETISEDPRHGNIVTIVRESIPRRAFSDWSMGFADISREDLERTTGWNDFLSNADAVRSLVPGRAQKLLTAFKDGRWRSKAPRTKPAAPVATQAAHVAPAVEGMGVAFQPIISVSQGRVISFEALAWDIRMQREVTAADQGADVVGVIEEEARKRAMLFSDRPDADFGININLRPTSADDAVRKMQSIIDQAKAQNLMNRSLTLELNQDYLDTDRDSVLTIVQDCKENGLKICLDHFGAGRSDLNQMETSQPNSIALNEQLVRDIDKNGTKQAIIRGLVQTCNDLGIDVIAKHVETESEFDWLVSEGIDMFQGGFFGNPRLNEFPTDVRIPEWR